MAMAMAVKVEGRAGMGKIAAEHLIKTIND
jgi:hypothetical protein